VLKTEQHILFPQLATNTWLVWDDESLEAILIDPAANSKPLLDRISHLKLKYIVNTHGHGDHIGGDIFFSKATGALLAIHEADAGMLIDNKKNLSAYMDMPLALRAADTLLKDGDRIRIGSYSFEIIHTPGHTPGGICLYCDKLLFAGDTLFEQSIGRTDFPGGSHSQLIHAIKSRLFILPDDTIVFPGHGPKTTIGIEKKTNPFIK
jgi:glyoxylase-like metal-dependent hydrolase (beta-lactamase superfamily II)